MALTRAEMDQKIDEHFEYEARDDVEGVLATLNLFPRPILGVSGLREGLFKPLSDDRVKGGQRFVGCSTCGHYDGC